MKRKVTAGRLGPAGSALAVALVSGMLAGGGPAAAAARTGSGRPRTAARQGPGPFRRWRAAWAARRGALAWTCGTRGRRRGENLGLCPATPRTPEGRFISKTRCRC